MNIDHINHLYELLDHEPVDPHADKGIRYLMRDLNISFDELSFTEAELEAKMRRVMVKYINARYPKIEERCDPNLCGIHIWMQRDNISFDELDFTEEELEEKMGRVMVKYINDLYERGSYVHISGWIRSCNISFDELNFTEAELEKRMERIREST